MSDPAEQTVTTDENCGRCGDVYQIRTAAQQHDAGGWWAHDGDPAVCMGCGGLGIAWADGEHAWVDDDYGDDDE